MSRRHPGNSETLQCSFCHKSQDTVQKLISGPNENWPRAYICDECIMVCASILEQERSDAGAVDVESGESHSLIRHPLAPQLLAAIEHWIRVESLGADATGDFAKVRALAIRLTPES